MIDVYMQGKDGELSKIGVTNGITITPDDNSNDIDYLVDMASESPDEFEMELYQDISVKRLFMTIIDPRLGNNNWRKHHGFPMWRCVHGR